MPRSGDPLPEDLENELFELHFTAPPEQRDQLLEAMCTVHPTHAAALRRQLQSLLRSDELLGHVRAELTTAAAERVGPFVVQRVLGQGGFGTVYLAEQEQPVRRQVALKVLQPERVNARSRQRFEDERQALARLQHACIAQVYDAGVTDRQLHYFAMEFVDGPPITEWCRRHHADTDTRLRLFLRVCGAIHHAHQRAVVHRDLKPSNVLVREEDGQPLPKVIDFGIAKLLAYEQPAGDATIQGAQIGTPGYMSPEQAAGEVIDTRTDVYSLGVLLCELLTGELPFSREQLQTGSFVALARLLQDGQPRRPSAIAAARGNSTSNLLHRLKTDLDWIVWKAIAARRDDRYTSVAALAEDVERHLALQPVLARRNVASYVVGKFVKRHRLAVVTVCLLAIAAIGSIAVLLWGLGEVEHARTQAEDERDIAQARDVAARMAVSQLALASGDTTTARNYLRTVPSERRKWSWRHLAAQCEASLRTIDLEQGCMEVTWLDDERVITFPMHGDITVWNIASGQIERHFDDWQETFRRVVLDRATERALIAADGSLSLWDARTGTKIRDVHELTGEPFALAWSHDRLYAAVGGRGHWLDIVDMANDGVSHRIELAHDITAITFLDDEQALVGDDSGTIWRVDVRTHEVLARITGHTDLVEALLVQPDADLVYSASVDATVRVWQLSTGAARATLPCSGRMRRLVLSSDGGTLYAGGGWASDAFAAWETTSFRLRGHFRGHKSGVSSIDIAPNGMQLASISRDLTLRLWSTAPPTSVCRLEAGRDARVLSVDHQRQRFAAASFDGKVTVWNGTTLTPELELHSDEQWTGSALAREVIYVAGRTVRALAIEDGRVCGEAATNGRRIESMAVSPDERWLVGGHLDHLLIWRLPELALAHDLACDVFAAPLTYDQDSGCFVVGCADATLRWIDPETGGIRREFQLPSSDTPITTLTRRGDLLLTGTHSGLELYRGDRHVRRMPTRNTCGSISMRGGSFATGSSDQQVRVWDTETGDQLLVFSDPVYEVRGVAFVGDDRHIIALAHRWQAPSYIYVWSAPPDASLQR